ncbi:MAG TPA: helicase-related protein [Thermoanaerobaculia bacterium]|nr:helicase-related protein [Thermoanaerobaculia bacterium]
MSRLEELREGATVRGFVPNQNVTVIATKWHGDGALTLTFRDANGRPVERLVYRHDESTFEVVEGGRAWSFDADGALLRLVSEARRISLAHLFDPYLAIHTSQVQPLPHQITAVYESMLPRQPLRFLLADDPGAGKTIMAGLFIKELILRGDLKRCLIVCPGILVEQWQDELHEKFGLDFDILSRQSFETSVSGNPFLERDLVICRLDHLSRNEELQAKLAQTDWDLIVCDEAHKMSASYFGNEAKYTKRYRLGQHLSGLTRNFLLMTATPHNGKEADFQLFMALLDGDRFEGKFREGTHTADPSDLMRRLVKEQLLKFDGKPLFPERIAYIVPYKLSDIEAELYKHVTDYVTTEFNRADQLESGGRKGTVGFALTTLRRRLASSPEAIYQSLRRRRERLEERLNAEKLGKRGAESRLFEDASLTEAELEDLEDAPEIEDVEEEVVDRATAAQTIAELEAEIEILRDLEQKANVVRKSNLDRKWDELRTLLQENSEILDERGLHRKLVLFTEHRDTLNYLSTKLRGILGREEAVVTIHGGMAREDRRTAQERFTHDPDVVILLATDAAGEGINLQRAHLMVNYDLPWNPNRIEQRFGRIHRIGQTEVCHLWNLVAVETREGDVYHRLLEKLNEEREALGGQVFDVLGKVMFEDDGAGPRTLRDLLIDAIRYGNRPEVRARLERVVENALDHEKLQMLIEEKALAHDAMDAARVQKIREEMERAEARKLQPHYIASFFREAFEHLGGRMVEREPDRWEIKHVPAVIRNRDHQIGTREVVLDKYERITFHKDLQSIQGKPLAKFVCPGHPLLDATVDLVLERHRDLLKQGAVLVDENDPGDEPRALFYLEHSIQDARVEKSGQHRVVSKRLLFVEMDRHGNQRIAGHAPYLDYRPLTSEERVILSGNEGEGSPDSILRGVDLSWLSSNPESRALDFAIEQIVPAHLAEVRARKEEIVTKAMAAVRERLTKEIAYWDHRAQQLKDQELAGKTNARLNSGKARQRAEELTARLHKRMEELEQERQLSPQPPLVVGGALIVPIGFIKRLKGDPVPATFARETDEVERLAMEAVMNHERALGFEPRDVSAQKGIGYDIESKDPKSGRLRFIEVKGRVAGADTVTVTRTEMLAALNAPDQWRLAIVIVDETNTKPVYLAHPFTREPHFSETCTTFNIEKLISFAGRNT